MTSLRGTGAPDPTPTDPTPTDPPPHPEPRLPNLGGPGGAGLPDQEPSGGSRRVWTYVALALILILFAILIQRVIWFSGPAFFTLTEVAATVLAFVVGGLALVRFYSKKRRMYLYIGTGFLGTGFLELHHSLSTLPLIDPGPDLPVWTWIAARVFLSLFLFGSWLAWYRETRGGREESSGGFAERSVYLTAAVLIVVIFLFFTRSPIAQAYHPDRLFSRPAEFVPAVFFALALGGYLTKGRWKSDPFEHWLIIALLISVVQHAGILVFSTHPYDGPADAAHLLKVASYAGVFVGLMMNFYVTFRREAAASGAIVQANADLAREVEVRREAERVLQESEERLQDFLEHAHDLIQSTSPEGRILYANEAWRRTLGYDEEQLEGLNIYALVHPGSRKAYRKVVERVLRGESVSDFQLAFVGRDGAHILCSGSSNARFENGSPVSTRSILRDVTEEFRAREELAASQAKLGALFESTGDAIWSVDRNRRLITFNTAFALTVEAITGREPAPGDPLDEMMVLDSSREWFQGCYDRALAGSRFSAVWEETVDGEARSFELYFNPIQSAAGITGVVVFSKDISRRLHVEDALRRAKREAEEGNRAKSQFLANMSHELRTPLNSVIGFANILMKDKEERLGGKEKEFLERILANGKHLLTLINEILDLSKIEAGRMEVELEAVELPDLIHETISQLGGQLAGRPVELRSEIPEGLQPFQTDQGKLKQVLINLVGNALKFTEEGQVTIRVETAPDSAAPERIAVVDSGPGIPEDRLDAIFEAFQQVDGGTTRKFGGTGLGLTISRSLCHLMGYHLSVSSRVGEGSTFSIQFHAAPEVREEEGVLRDLGRPPRSRWAPVSTAGRAAEMKGRTVLVVDDEEDSRYLLRDYLEDVGCRVVTAADGVEGLEVARKVRPDLITVDLMMPRMSGWEMLRAIKEDDLLRKIPVVVVSIVAEEGSGLVLGGVDLLNKPVERDEFLQVLRRNLLQESGRVLIVEDDPDTRRLLQHYLREAGLVPHTAETGKKALEFLASRIPDLILLDLLMPEMDGPAMLRHLRSHSRYAAIPVVILTGKDLNEEETETLSRQAMDVIVKGDDVERRLRAVLDQLFGHPRSDPPETFVAGSREPGSPASGPPDA